MQKLHMVGFTTDHRSLIFSVRRGAKSGGYVIGLDEGLVAAIEEYQSHRDEESEAEAKAAASPRPQSLLSVREMQVRLRRGRTIEQVAREAGVEPSWVARFAVPVLAEQAEVIRAARATRMVKQRVVSGATVGDAVYRNLAERGVTDPRDQLDRSWRARQLTEGMWLVSFSYTHRGRDLTASWEYDEVTGGVHSRGRLGSQLGFRVPRRAPMAPRPAAGKTTKSTVKAGKATKKAPAKKRAAPVARQSSSRQATRRVSAARRAAEARMVSEAQRATRRNVVVVRKAAKNPIVLPPRRVFEAPSPALNDSEPEVDVDAAPDAEVEPEVPEVDAVEPEVEAIDVEAVELVQPSHDVDPDPEPEPLPGVVVESEPQREVVVHVEPDPDPEPEPLVRRRQPLRARPVLTETTNGPVFRRELAPPAAIGSTPELPLSLPLEPIEPPPRRRRLRPLRGR
ncbi:MAG TPA: septation protein SepH [Acidimicrobiales bacterium]|nr:septation protein SepH [Acidimicrobiales bacterium]